MAAVCEVEGCDRDLHSAVHCHAHHDRLKRHGDVRADVPVRAYVRRPVGERPVVVPPVDVVEVYRVAFSPAPTVGHGFLWLV